ncbi:hypothetical protein K466DRAFT_484133 [Polyporus arcularius HHB13444]|uniref:Uncharacterized protein n=1 Tax=Polyporus arcularius HHB13444 TaxID=1314778 RepID=A0A5C3PR26_9APHY|nr:hypothetical protein K466DRAFT_484133 [Polyporus arcularius HHB13444]
MDPAILTPPLSASGSDIENQFSFDRTQLNDDFTAACPSSTLRYERKMGDTELSYFLPSRQTGVNDMYLHLGFKAHERITKRLRVCTVWAILRLRHPLLCGRAEMHDYDDVRFVYDAPSSAADAYLDADANLEYRMQNKDELIDTYLNGARTLSNTRLSYLILSEPLSSPELMPTPPRTPSPTSAPLELHTVPEAEDPGAESDRQHQYELLICAMHFLGDGMALHQFANDFFGLLGGEKSDDELREMLHEEWRVRWGDVAEEPVLPSALEDNMPMSASPFRRVAAKVDFELSQQKLLGGQTFPRRKHPERLTIVPTVSFPEDRTKAILKKCKTHGVSISAALFAMCNVAWARLGAGNREMPTLMYSALNLRPYFTKGPSSSMWNSYWYLAIGYFNVILPSFLPSDAASQEATFWLRARQAKEQSTRAAKNPLVASRTQEMAKERGERARAWAKEDDERENGTYVPPAPAAAPASDGVAKEPVLPARAKAPSAALIGLSLLGNLDGIYKHATFPAVKLHTLTTGSRQRNGAMLLFGYTFAGKLWISLGYDSNGFAGDVVDRFWKEALDCVDEFLG